MAVKEREESSQSSMQQHENMVNDNLGRIARNIARNFANNSIKKRQSASSEHQSDAAG